MPTEAPPAGARLASSHRSPGPLAGLSKTSLAALARSQSLFLDDVSGALDTCEGELLAVGVVGEGGCEGFGGDGWRFGGAGERFGEDAAVGFDLREAEKVADGGGSVHRPA